MKYFIFSMLLTFFVAGCEQKKTQETVLDTDTTGVEYKVEQEVKETTVDVDTTTKTKTIEKDSQ